jgi:hypothetical protein
VGREGLEPPTSCLKGSSRDTAWLQIEQLLVRRRTRSAGMNTVLYLKVPDWLVEMHRYDTRDFDAPSCPEPAVTVESIRTRCKAAGLAPVIWLEELDKYTPTRVRTNYLYRLIDGVYEMGGSILASANLKLPELQEHLGDAIYRRISGANDADGDYRIMDLHELAKIDKAVRVRKSKTT